MVVVVVVVMLIRRSKSLNIVMVEGGLIWISVVDELKKNGEIGRWVVEGDFVLRDLRSCWFVCY